MEVIDIINPVALETPQFKEIATLTLKVSKGQYTEIPGEWLTEDDTKVLVAAEDGAMHGMLVAFLQEPPQIAMIYTKNAKAKRALVQHILELLRDKGYTRFWAINGTPKPDSVWKRALWREGAAEKIGSILEFAL